MDLPWSFCPRIVDRSTKLEPGAKLIYRTMLAFLYRPNDDKAWPSQCTLAQEVALSVRQVQRHLDCLEEIGLILKRKEGRNNIYYFIDPKKADLFDAEPQGNYGPITPTSDSQHATSMPSIKTTAVSPDSEPIIINNKKGRKIEEKAQNPDIAYTYRENRVVDDNTEAALAFLNSIGFEGAEKAVQRYGPRRILANQRRFDAKKKSIRNPAGLFKRMLADELTEGEISGGSFEKCEEYLRDKRDREVEESDHDLKSWLARLDPEERASIERKVELDFFRETGMKKAKGLLDWLLKKPLYLKYRQRHQRRLLGHSKSLGSIFVLKDTASFSKPVDTQSPLSESPSVFSTNSGPDSSIPNNINAWPESLLRQFEDDFELFEAETAAERNLQWDCDEHDNWLTTENSTIA